MDAGNLFLWLVCSGFSIFSLCSVIALEYKKQKDIDELEKFIERQMELVRDTEDDSTPNTEHLEKIQNWLTDFTDKDPEMVAKMVEEKLPD